MTYTNADVIIDEEFADTEDLDGLFSGWRPRSGSYDISTWQYEGIDGVRLRRASARRASTARRAGPRRARRAAGARRPPVDATRPSSIRAASSRSWQAPLRRYTPEMVEEICGVPQEQFLEVAEALCENSGRERTSAFCYAVGWTQHTVGVQYIRTAAIIQLLLGNIGRPGGGILALRGHASIQGSTDIPTLYNILPGYIPMPHAAPAPDASTTTSRTTRPPPATGATWTPTSSACSRPGGATPPTADNDWALRLPAAASPATTRSTRRCSECSTARSRASSSCGENPAVGSANSQAAPHGDGEARLAGGPRLPARSRRASFWKDSPEIETGELAPEDIATEVFFLPAASHTEKDGSFTNTQRLLQWHHKAVEPPGRLPLGAVVRLPPRPAASARSWPARASSATGRSADLTWDYPTQGPHDEPDAEAVLGEINGQRRRRRAAVELHGAEGRRLDRVRLLDLLRLLRRRRQPAGPPQAADASRAGSRRSGAGRGRRTAASSTTAPRPTRTAARGRSASATSGGTRRRAVDRARRARLQGRQAARLRPAGWRHRAGRARRRRAVHHAGGRAGLAVRARRAHRRAAAHPLRAARVAVSQPAVRPAGEPGPPAVPTRAENPYNPSAGEPGAERLPVRRHHLPADRAPHRRRDVPRRVPYLARAAAGVLLRGLARARRRARAGARRVGDDRHRAHRDRGAGAGDRAGRSRCGRRARHPPGRPALPLGHAGLVKGDSANDLFPSSSIRTCTSRR